MPLLRIEITTLVLPDGRYVGITREHHRDGRTHRSVMIGTWPSSPTADAARERAEQRRLQRLEREANTQQR